ncbi:extracellular solute-binding protein [Aquibacillus albus]|uniref:Aldouronate transport system substrate-binding protein n=1 Tax=Aquibacillus albus TaxID=1168171 RepID=A0ABS2MW16_9BACI|nr:extracellular solute-binding protein [Aquibacillus albus]MBM7570094.1 putative aldouronate transport system substrate-binding protein [Aquibacillus albus]
MLKNKVIILLLVFAFVTVLSACNSSDNAEQASNNQEDSSDTSDSSTPDSGDSGGEAEVDYDPLGKYDETITLSTGICVEPGASKSLPEGDTLEDNEYTRAVKEDLNIELKEYWSVSCTNKDQKISLSIASNDLPDAMIVNRVQLRKLVEAGQIADLSEAVKYALPMSQDAWASSDGKALASATFDGKLMAIPSSNHSDGSIKNLWIRKDWLDNLGLEVPQTLEDLETVAKAFIEQDPDGNGQDDTLGIMGMDVNDILYSTFLEGADQGLGSIFYAKDAYPGYWVEGPDGQATYGSVLPETKEALSFLRDWYDEGLIDTQLGIRKDNNEPIIAGKAGIFFQSLWAVYEPLSNAWKGDPTANWQAYAVPLNGEGKWNQTVNATSNNFIVVRKDYEHPEAAVKALNYRLTYGDYYEFEHGLDASHIPLRVDTQMRDQMYRIAELIERVAIDGEPREILDVPWEPSLYEQDYDDYLEVKKEPYDEYDLEYWNTDNIVTLPRIYARVVGTRPIRDPNRNDISSLVYEQTPTMSERWANLMKLETETFLKIIMGAAPLDDFDKFVEDWKKQGGDTITSEVRDIVK